jgi:hypothetical protein
MATNPPHFRFWILEVGLFPHKDLIQNFFFTVFLLSPQSKIGNPQSKISSNDPVRLRQHEL